jgi:hypothetical protein
MENFMEVGLGPNWGCSAKGKKKNAVDDIYSFEIRPTPLHVFDIIYDKKLTLLSVDTFKLFADPAALVQYDRVDA